MDIFVPDMYYQSIYKIDYNKLKRMKIKCLLFSLDNTIVPYSKNEPDKKLKELFASLSLDFKIIIVSNRDKNRLRPFKEQLNVDTAFRAHKPHKSKMQKILKLYYLKQNDVAFIGDELLTDIYGANRMNFVSIFVNPISKIEPKEAKLRRIIERKIVKRYNKRGILIVGDYYA